MSTVQMHAHAVTARKIDRLAPLRSGDGLAAPNEGVSLILEDGTKIRWGLGAAASIPQAGDWFIQDAEFGGVSFVISPAKFAALFTVAD
jgi:hypothetical protein